MRLPSANCPALKKYGDWRPALVRKSPNRSAPARIANSTNSRRSSASPECAAGAAAACMTKPEVTIRVYSGPTAANAHLMRIITCNVNGLRSAAGKGFMAWAQRQKPDVLCLQEIKAQEADLAPSLLAPRGLHAFFHPAEKRGYSGVAIYARKEPDNVTLGLGVKDIDAQGRFLQ